MCYVFPLAASAQQASQVYVLLVEMDFTYLEAVVFLVVLTVNPAML